MKIAVTSQNRRSVTNHAGRCRRFWIFEVKDQQVVSQQLLELNKGEALHDIAPAIPNALQTVDKFVTAGLCDNMKNRLSKHGIAAISTDLEDPVQAALSASQ
ncbi:MAG: NifB/NifX family molybdenum-iron cluster-binding protein [Halieaceae bacterium]|jgi:predicted Fe-Mo cluster-binding NifX family protein|nr:NifB/NifX family molybdenum-iron cluster-binding protein [Halieaceae bacterium]